MTKKEELDIWAQIQKGDKTAFNKVYHIHIDSLYNYGSSITPDIQLIEDAIQEMFINIWIKRSTISINSNVKSYLFTSLRRQLIAQIEKQKKTDLKTAGIERPAYNKTETSISDQRIDQIKRQLSKLSIREKEAIVLKYQEGLSYDEISSLMSLKNHAIYKLVSRGVKKIKENIRSGLLLFI